MGTKVGILAQLPFPVTLLHRISERIIDTAGVCTDSPPSSLDRLLFRTNEICRCQTDFAYRAQYQGKVVSGKYAFGICNRALSFPILLFLERRFKFERSFCTRKRVKKKGLNNFNDKNSFKEPIERILEEGEQLTLCDS